MLFGEEAINEAHYYAVLLVLLLYIYIYIYIYIYNYKIDLTDRKP